MATSFLLRSPSDGNNGGERAEEQRNKVSEEKGTMLDVVKQRGRKSGKSNAPKKQPQRGLGVAQLERLRVEERLKKMTEIHQLQAQNLHCHFPHQIPFSFLDQQPDRVPVPLARFSTSVNYGYESFGDGYSSSQQAFLFHSYNHGNGGLVAPGGGSGARGMFSNQLQVDRYRNSSQDAWSKTGNTFETAKELSSIQRMQCFSDQCEICLKKKRINGENLGFIKDEYKQIMPMDMDGRDFLGLSCGGNKAIYGESKDIGVNGSWRSDCSHPNVKEEADAVAIHGKGNYAGRSFLMEYEFFPHGGSGSSSNKVSSSLAEASPSVLFTEASHTTATAAPSAINNTNFIDLSLRLSR